MRKDFHKKLLFIAGMFLSIQAYAVQNMTQVWPTVNWLGDFQNPKYKYVLDGQARVSVPANIYRQLIAEGGLAYQYNPLTSLWLGFTFSTVHGDSVEKMDRKDRLWQQVNYKAIETQHYSIDTRTRLDESVSKTNEGIAVRIREKVTVKMKLPNTERIVPEVFDELYVYLVHPAWTNDNNPVDQNFAFIGFLVNLTPKISSDIGYLNQYEITNTGNQTNKVFYLSLNFIP